MKGSQNVIKMWRGVERSAGFHDVLDVGWISTARRAIPIPARAQKVGSSSHEQAGSEDRVHARGRTPQGLPVSHSSPSFLRAWRGPYPWAVTWMDKEKVNLGWESQTWGKCGLSCHFFGVLWAWGQLCEEQVVDGCPGRENVCRVLSPSAWEANGSVLFMVSLSIGTRHVCVSGCSVYSVSGEQGDSSTCDPVNCVKWAGTEGKIWSAQTADRSIQYLISLSAQKFKY